jgi:hypothetical protein
LGTLGKRQPWGSSKLKKLREKKIAVRKPSRMRSPFRFSSNRLELLTFLGDEKRLIS